MMLELLGFLGGYRITLRDGEQKSRLEVVGGLGELVCGHPRVARWSRSSAVRKQAVTVFQCFISTCVLDKKIFPETYQSLFRKCAIAATLFKAVFSP